MKVVGIVVLEENVLIDGLHGVREVGDGYRSVARQVGVVVRRYRRMEPRPWGGLVIDDADEGEMTAPRVELLAILLK